MSFDELNKKNVDRIVKIHKELNEKRKEIIDDSKYSSDKIKNPLIEYLETPSLQQIDKVETKYSGISEYYMNLLSNPLFKNIKQEELFKNLWIKYVANFPLDNNEEIAERVKKQYLEYLLT